MDIHLLPTDADLEPLDTALLIVDVQEGFVNDSTRHVVPAVEKLQYRYEHIYATRFINGADSPHRNFIDWHRFGEYSPEIELAFVPSPKAVILDKTAYTCVTPAFMDDLRERGVVEVHICGIDTDVCVLKCAVDLFENGIRPVVLSQASASHAGDDYHQSALHILPRLIGARQVL